MNLFIPALFPIMVLLWTRLKTRAGGNGLLILLCILIFSMTWLQFDRVGKLKQFKNSSVVKTHDFYHYFISSKYFEEVGYDRIYFCTISAIKDLKKENPGQKMPVINNFRDLNNTQVSFDAAKTNTHVNCKPNFSKQRWQEFKQDILTLVTIESRNFKWQYMLIDMGNNPTPTWYAMTHHVANLIPFNTSTVYIFALLDYILLFALIPFLLWRTFGKLAAIGYLIIFTSNELAHFSWIMGSYGRSLWFVTLTAGYCLLKNEKLFFAALCFAIAITCRVFPVVFIAPLVLFMFLDNSQRRQSIKLALYLLVTGISLVLLTSLLWGTQVWQDFAGLIGKRINMVAPPMVSLHKAFYLLYIDYLDHIRNTQDFKLWTELVDIRFKQYQVPIFAFAGLLSAALLYGLNKLKQPLFASLIAGLCLMFCFMKPLTYYYMYVALLPAFYIFGDRYKKDLGPFFLVSFLFIICSHSFLRKFGFSLTTYEFTAIRSLLIFMYLVAYTIILNRPDSTLPANPTPDPKSITNT